MPETKNSTQKTKDGDQILLRRMEEADLDAVARIEAASFTEPWSRKGFSDSLGDKNSLFVTALVNGEVAGYAGLLQSFDEADVTNVAVEEHARKKGIGKAVVEFLMSEGRTRGIERFTLEVRRSNEAAICLYEQLGFASVGYRRNFYKFPTEDANIMWTGQQEE